MADFDWTEVRWQHIVVQEQISGRPVLPGHEVFVLQDTHGLPLEIIRVEARRKGMIVDEWGLRLSMYLAGRDVPKPKLWEIPRRAEEESPASNTEESAQAWSAVRADISLFICGVPDTRLVCKTPGCGKRTSFACTMPLAGARIGKMCGRPVCIDCLRGTASCPPHQARSVKR